MRPGEMTQFVVWSEEETQVLAGVCRALSRGDVTVREIAAERLGDVSYVRVTGEPEPRLLGALREAGFDPKERRAFVLELSEGPAEVARVAAALEERGVEVLYVHAARSDGKLRAVVVAGEPEKAAAILAPWAERAGSPA